MSRTLERNETSYKNELDQLKLKIEELEMHIRTINFEKKQVENKFENQELLISSLENEISILKNICSNSNSADYNILKQQVEECEKCKSEFDESLQVKLNSLQKENDELKLELGNTRNRLSAQRIDKDTETTRLEQENESYKQQIHDLTNKLLSKFLDEKTIEEQLQLIGTLENSKSRLENELLKAKVLLLF